MSCTGRQSWIVRSLHAWTAAHSADIRNTSLHRKFGLVLSPYVHCTRREITMEFPWLFLCFRMCTDKVGSGIVSGIGFVHAGEGWRSVLLLGLPLGAALCLVFGVGALWLLVRRWNPLIPCIVLLSDLSFPFLQHCAGSRSSNCGSSLPCF